MCYKQRPLEEVAYAVVAVAGPGMAVPLAVVWAALKRGPRLPPGRDGGLGLQCLLRDLGRAVLERLEAAVAALQDGQMPLERALQLYEEGMKLAQHCNELLQKAELRVQQLSVNDMGVPVVQHLEVS